MSFNQQPQSKQHSNHAEQASPPSAYVVAQRERTYQRWLRPLLGEPPWPVSETGQGFLDRRLWPSDWAGLAHQLRPCHSWAEVLAQLKAWLLAQPERLLRLLAALPPGQALRRLSLPQLVVLALSAGLTAGMVGQPLVALAQEPVPVGGEFRVNSYTTNGQRGSSVAMDADGDFVIIWHSFGQDNSSDGVYAQQYNANGVPQGSEFQVNTYTTGTQRDASIAMDVDGNFVIVWESGNIISTQDGNDAGIYAQRYNADGSPQNTEFQVNTYTTGFQRFPSIASDASGNFVIVWESLGQDGSDIGIYARRYDSNGTPLDNNEFRVNSYTTGYQWSPAVAMNADGDFVVAWQDGNTVSGQDGNSYGIYAQRYSLNGTPQGSEFQVNVYTIGRQSNPSVAMDIDGDFVITWGSYASLIEGIFARQYNKDGAPLDNIEFQVETFTTNFQQQPNVAMDTNGDFVIAWSSGSFSGGQAQDGSIFGIFAQKYDKNGIAQGSEFQVNTYTIDRQVAPSIAMDMDGDFVIAWQSGPDFTLSNPGQDGSNYGIYAQRYALSPIPQLELNKNVNEPNPQFSQHLTYTLTVDNRSFLTVTNAVISDTLPGALAFAGPVTLEGSTGTVADETADLPILASGLTIAPNGRITVTLPVTVTVEEGQITNVAAVTSSEVITPVTGFVTITVGERKVYLPLVLKGS